MAQALMLMMESQVTPAKQIAGQAMAMAVRRVTNDNTIRYVRACLIFGGFCVALGALVLWLLAGQADVAACLGNGCDGLTRSHRDFGRSLQVRLATRSLRPISLRLIW